MDPLHLRVFVWMFFQSLSVNQNATLSDVSWTFSDKVLGSLNITDVVITGFETLTNNVMNMDASEDEDGNNNLCVHFPAEHLELTLNYETDVGADNEIPIYGDGQLLYRLENIVFNACMFINQNEHYVDDVKVSLLYRHRPLELTGFWRQREVSIILTRLLNTANRFIAMKNMYEPELTSCLWNPVVTYFINRWFEYENATLNINPTCAQAVFFNEYDAKGIDVEHDLRKMLKSHGNVPIIKHLTENGMGPL